MSHPLWALTLTRIRLVFREPAAIFWTFGFPVFLAVVLALAFRSKPPDPIAIAVEDGPGAARLVDALNRRPDVHARQLTTAEAHQALRAGQVALVVSPGAPRTYTFDRTRPESRLARAVADDLLQAADGRKDPTPVADHPVTEAGSRYIDFFIPGLVGMNIMSSSLWSIAFAIVEMRSQRLLKRFVATPMKRGQLLASFVLMRLVFLLFEVPFVLIFARIAFGVVVHGSLPLFFAMSVLSALAFAGIALLVGSRTSSTQVAGGFLNLVMMPMFLMSGVFFSSASFPEIFQPIIKILPLTVIADALRAIMNDGAGSAAMAGPALILTTFAVVSFGVALRIFRWE